MRGVGCEGEVWIVNSGLCSQSQERKSNNQKENSGCAGQGFTVLGVDGGACRHAHVLGRTCEPFDITGRPGGNPGQMDGFVSQLPYECYLEEVASVGE